MEFNTLEFTLGAHITWNKTFNKTIKHAIKNNMTALQCFMGSPKSFKRCLITDDDIKASLQLLDRFPTYVFTHAPYLYNLAGSKHILAWNEDSNQDKKTKQVLTSLHYELKILSNFPNNGVIVHPGNHINRKDGIHTIAKSINKIDFPPNSNLLLENSAGQGTSLATTLEELHSIYTLVTDKAHVGICLDTAHLFGYGDYNLSKSSEVERLFDDFHTLFGLDKLKLIHLNDSLVPLGSKKDRHALIGTGYIWGESIESLIVLFALCKKANIPIILETDEGDVSKIIHSFSSAFQI
jgi:deoxyribonuclease-4